MPRSSAGLPKDPTVSEEPRFAVIEPPKPSQLREKTYFSQVTGTFDKIKLTEGKLIKLTPDDAFALVESRRIIPLSIALNLGLYPSTKKSLADKLKASVAKAVGVEVGAETTTESKTAPLSSTQTTKSFLGNKLRDAIQAKKVESDKLKATTSSKTTSGTSSSTTKSSSLTADKLAAIKAGGKK